MISIPNGAMKSLHSILFLFLLTGCVVSCKKATPNIVGSCGSPPQPVGMILLDKQGHNLVKSVADKVVFSYVDNGQTQTIPCVIKPLQDLSTGQPTTKYDGGLGVGCDLGGYSVRQSNPIKTFQVIVNSQAAGTIYYDLQKNTLQSSATVQDCFTVISFQLNTVPVQTDKTVIPFVAVLNCTL